MDKKQTYIGLGFVCVLLAALVMSGCGKKFVSQKTNKEGEVILKDKETKEEVIVKVVDRKAATPLQNITVSYEKAEGVNVFTAVNPKKEYFPEIDFFPHNSSHILKMEKVGDKTYSVEEITSSGKIKLIQKWASSKGIV
ncbi:MAG: hypothetical protein KKH28_09975 [Elusimicrobia bacterium]|nr:hypothetical protein [Elusimicrobiota bacterium]